MALTITLTDDNAVDGDKRVRRGTIQFDNSYPTGGEAVSAADLKLNGIESFNCDNVSRQGNRLIAVNMGLAPSVVVLVVYTALGTEALNASDQSTQFIGFEAVGY